MIPVLLGTAADRQYHYAVLIKKRAQLFICQLADMISHGLYSFLTILLRNGRL